MSTLLDSYTGTITSNIGDEIAANGFTWVAQSFTPSETVPLESVEFFFRRVGTLTGNLTMSIHDHTGTYGTSSLPGTLLVSATKAASTVSTTAGYVNVPITGVTLTAGVRYVLRLQYTGGDVNSGNTLDNQGSLYQTAGTNSAHPGNYSTNIAGTIAAVPRIDARFRVYGESISLSIDSMRTVPQMPNLFVGPVTPITIPGKFYGGYGGHIIGGAAYGAGSTTGAGNTTLSVNSLSVGTTISAVTLTQDYNLTVNNLAVGTTISTVALVENRTLAINNLAVATTIGSPTLVQDYKLSVANITTNTYIENITLAVAGSLIVQNIQVNTSTNNIDLVQQHTLSINSLNIATFLQSILLSFNTTLALNSLNVQTTISALTLAYNVNLNLDTLSVSTSMDNLTLLSSIALQISNLGIGTFLDNLSFLASLNIDSMYVNTFLEHLIQTFDYYKPDIPGYGNYGDVTIDSGMYRPELNANGLLVPQTLDDSGIYRPDYIQQGKY